MGTEPATATPAAAVRWTFDGGIHDNSLPVSPDSPDGQFVRAGNLGDKTVSVMRWRRKVVATVTGFRAPRQEIVFTRAGAPGPRSIVPWSSA